MDGGQRGGSPPPSTIPRRTQDLELGLGVPDSTTKLASAQSLNLSEKQLSGSSGNLSLTGLPRMEWEAEGKPW